MTKRRRWQARPADQNIPDWMRHIKPTGRGLSSSVADCGFWFGDETGDIDPWIRTFEVIDKKGNKRSGNNKPLVDLLRSDFEMTPRARFYLADLIERHQLIRKPGQQTTAAYDRTEAELMLEWADISVRAAREAGLPLKASLERGADRFEYISEEARAEFIVQLAAFHRGNRNSTRRMKKRRPDPNL